MGHFTDPTNKPDALGVWFHSLPRELTCRHRWVIWSWAYLKRAWRKPPRHPETDIRHYLTKQGQASFHACVQRYHADPSVDGVGIVLADGMGLTVFDLDHCRDPDTGHIDPRAQAFAQTVDSYTDISPSGAESKVLAWG